MSESSPGPVLANARLYLVAGERMAADRLADLVPKLAAAGVDLLQLREKELEAGAILTMGAEVARACDEAGLPFVINDRPDIAAILGTGVHVGQDDVPFAHARRFVPGEIVDFHSRAPRVDTACSGPSARYIAVGPSSRPDEAGVRRPTRSVRYASERATCHGSHRRSTSPTAEVVDAGAGGSCRAGDNEAPDRYGGGESARPPRRVPL